MDGDTKHGALVLARGIVGGGRKAGTLAAGYTPPGSRPGSIREAVLNNDSFASQEYHYERP